jgi:xanthine dehydrogenase accessory factor
VRSPAGLAIGATTPEEIALSILAEIVQVRRAAAAEAKHGGDAESTESGAAATAVDPICGMTVDVAGARHVADWQGTSFYFCCGGCRERFLAEPARRAAAGTTAGGAGSTAGSEV